jgi:hypothetical protein
VAVVSWIGDVALLVCVCACRVDRVIVMDKGGIVHQGRYADLVAAGVDVVSCAASPSSVTTPSTSDEYATACVPLECDVVCDRSRCSSEESITSYMSTSSEGESTPLIVRTEQPVQQRLPDVRATQACESSLSGAVSGDVYKKYGQSLGGLKFAVGFLVVSVTLEAARTGTNLWLAQWSDHPDSDTTQQLAVYVSLGIATALLSMVRNFSWFHATYVASGRLHEGMLCGVLRSPMSWFNATPQGRILNRFSKDLDVIDQAIPHVWMDAISTTFEVWVLGLRPFCG